MGQACNCDCDDGKYELYQENFNQVRMNGNSHRQSGYQNLKPLKRAPQNSKQDGIDSSGYGNNSRAQNEHLDIDSQYENNNLSNRSINQHNAFEQTFEDLLPKLRNDIPGLIFVDNYMFPNGSMYKGQMLIEKNGNQSQNTSQGNGGEMRCGYGIQKWVDGAVYEGEWVNNKAEGKGTFWHAEGDIYTGQFKADQANGFGVYTHVNGSRYEGEWVNDVQEGQGEETWVDGAKYVGKYRNGMKHGYGVYQWADGSEFKGNWEENKITGYGVYYWEDGRIYEGYWKQNNMHGQGLYKWPDGRQYEGQYVDDKKEGYGVYQYPDGRCYKGQWLNGKQHGEGTFVSPEGISRKGEWKNGKRLYWLDEMNSEYTGRDSLGGTGPRSNF